MNVHDTPPTDPNYWQAVQIEASNRGITSTMLEDELRAERESKAATKLFPRIGNELVGERAELTARQNELEEKEDRQRALIREWDGMVARSHALGKDLVLGEARQAQALSHLASLEAAAEILFFDPLQAPQLAPVIAQITDYRTSLPMVEKWLTAKRAEIETHKKVVDAFAAEHRIHCN